MSEITLDQVKDRARVEKLKPKESDFQGKKGYERKYLPDGTYRWRYRFVPNDGHGRLTREAAVVQEMMRPFQVADTERHAKLEAKVERERLRDEKGQRQFVDPALADQTALRNGWSHDWRAGGVSVRSGVRGKMLWRRRNGSWEPTGKAKVGILEPRLPCRGIQVDPDGNPWRGVDREWVRL